MNWPWGVRISLLKKVVSGRTRVVDGIPVIVDGGGATCTGNNCCEEDCVRSKISSEFCGGLPEPVPEVAIKARPSAPTSTPCGWAGSVTVWTTARELRSTTLSDELC